MRNLQKYRIKTPGSGSSGLLVSIELLSLFVLACSAPAVKMKCSELRFRANLESRTEDQKRFMAEELIECEEQVKEAKQKDSASLNKLEQRFPPKSDEDAL